MSSSESEIKEEEVAESDVRKGVRGGARLVGEGSDLTYSLFPAPPASVLGCLWEYQACAWEGWSR